MRAVFIVLFVTLPGSLSLILIILDSYGSPDLLPAMFDLLYMGGWLETQIYRLSASNITVDLIFDDLIFIFQLFLLKH